MPGRVEAGDLLEASQGQPGHREGLGGPRIMGRVSDVAGGGATGDPFADIAAGHVAVWVTQCEGRLPKTLSCPELGWAPVGW